MPRLYCELNCDFHIFVFSHLVTDFYRGYCRRVYHENNEYEIWQGIIANNHMKKVNNYWHLHKNFIEFKTATTPKLLRPGLSNSQEIYITSHFNFLQIYTKTMDSIDVALWLALKFPTSFAIHLWTTCTGFAHKNIVIIAGINQ